MAVAVAARLNILCMALLFCCTAFSRYVLFKKYVIHAGIWSPGWEQKMGMDLLVTWLFICLLCVSFVCPGLFVLHFDAVGGPLSVIKALP